MDKEKYFNPSKQEIIDFVTDYAKKNSEYYSIIDGITLGSYLTSGGAIEWYADDNGNVVKFKENEAKINDYIETLKGSEKLSTQMIDFEVSEENLDDQPFAVNKYRLEWSADPINEEIQFTDLLLIVDNISIDCVFKPDAEGNNIINGKANIVFTPKEDNFALYSLRTNMALTSEINSLDFSFTHLLWRGLESKYSNNNDLSFKQALFNDHIWKTDLIIELFSQHKFFKELIKNNNEISNKYSDLTVDNIFNSKFI